ncbi:MAG: DUF3102 domain-containing protein [Clostridia bacterium]|nr:DUF3102 domain-containing protein [Clostridia bacterium]
MENQVIKQEKQELQVREISVITDEIISLKAQANNMMLMYAIEVGRRLVEAKAMLPHGEWGTWLREKVDFSQRTANNLMNIYEEYGKNSNSQLIANLNYTKAVRLLVLSEDEREEFVQENNIDDMTVKELEKALQERDEALAKLKLSEENNTLIEDLKRKLEEANENIRELDKKAEAMAGKALKAEQELEERLAEIQSLRDNPEVSQEVIDRLKAEALEASKNAIEEERLKNAEAIEKAKEAKKRAEESAKTLKTQIEELEKRVKLSSPDVMEFKFLFDRLQKDASELFKVMVKVKENDTEIYGKLASALIAFFNQGLSRC